MFIKIDDEERREIGMTGYAYVDWYYVGENKIDSDVSKMILENCLIDKSSSLKNLRAYEN